jgi:hypothetical protein
MPKVESSQLTGLLVDDNGYILLLAQVYAYQQHPWLDHG